MAATHRRLGHTDSASIALALVVAACTTTPSLSPPAARTPPAESRPPTTAPSAGSEGPPASGGTIYLLKELESFTDVDPQRLYTNEDLAFFGATLYRSLEAYTPSPDSVTGTTLTPDLATDLGRPTDDGRTWTFTLREGVTFETGAPITCEDIRYGVSRTFANDVLGGGPTYAILYLDIPGNPISDPNDRRSQYLSAYYGPYDGTGQDLFDRAVECSGDHRTITFHLNRPVADFNDATTLGFFPVPKAADTGEAYGGSPQPGRYPVSSGPYRIERYEPGKPGTMVLVRNDHWNITSDPIRRANPDRWVVELGVDPGEIDQRLMAAEGEDAFALPVDALGSAAASRIYGAGDTPSPAFADRAVSGFDQYARYIWINVVRVPNVKVRQAIMVALDRAAIRDAYGGVRAGELADGVVMPDVGIDYAPTGIWDTYFGQAIQPSGDPALARRLLAESGVTAAPLRFSAYNNPTNQRVGQIIVDSLAKAGLTATSEAICEGYGCGIVFDPAKGPDMGSTGWGADWPSASTVLVPLFTKDGGWNQSFVDDPAFAAGVEDALSTLDRASQAAKWQALNRMAVENAWVVPTLFTRSQRLAGPRIAPLYRWPAYNSWPYPELSVR